MTFEEFRDQFHISLTEQQMAAVLRTEGPTLVLAVPGSGKTTVLVTRLGYMIYCKQIPPEKILTLTYTVAAAGDMADRFCSMFGEKLRERMEFRTINGICARVLYFYGRSVGKQMFPLLDKEEERKSMLSLIYRQVTGGYATEGELQEIGARITFIKNMMLTEEELEKYGEETDLPIVKIYQAYEAELKRRKVMDFDDQMVYAWKILKSFPQVLQYFQKKYPYICVDEAQDTSKIQHVIIALLAKAGENLFMVGDEDQSIYGFRAAYPQALLDFEKNHPGAQVLLMEQNFRSDAHIVEAADHFIQKNALRHKKSMRAARPGKTDIQEIRVNTRKAQYVYLAKMAGDETENQTNMTAGAAGISGTTAVLYRDNESVIPLIDLLEREGTPYNIKNADLSFFSNRVVADICSILRFAENPSDTEEFLRIYYKLSLYMTKQNAEKAAALSLEYDLPVLDAVIRYGKMPAYVQTNAKDIRSALRELPDMTARDALNTIINDMGYKAYLDRASISDSKLFTLKTIAAREETPIRFLDRLSELQQIIRTKRYAPQAKVILSTIHSSKGLEYDSVYLLDVIDGVFPENVPVNLKNMSKEDREKWEEERRLFYVGVTRAKNQLRLFTIKKEDSVFLKEFRSTYAYKRQQDEGKRVCIAEPGTEADIPAVLRANSTRQKSARITAYEEKTDEGFLHFCDELGEGLLVTHKKFGQGVITAMNSNTVTILFEDGEKKLGLKILYAKNLLQTLVDP